MKDRSFDVWLQHNAYIVSAMNFDIFVRIRLSNTFAKGDNKEIGLQLFGEEPHSPLWIGIVVVVAIYYFFLSTK